MDHLFRLANRKRKLPHLLRGRGDRLGSVECQQGFGMSGSEFALLDRVLYRFGKSKKAKQIGDGGALASGALGHLLLGEIELARQALKGSRLFHRVQSLALEVFDDGHLHRLLVRDLLDHSGNELTTQLLRSTPPALAGNELEAP